MLWRRKAARALQQTPENPRAPPKNIRSGPCSESHPEPTPWRFLPRENPPGCCSQTPIPPSLRRAGSKQRRERDEREASHRECCPSPARGGEQDWDFGGLGQALPTQLHKEGFTPSSPRLLKVGDHSEHPTEIRTTDTPLNSGAPPVPPPNSRALEPAVTSTEITKNQD